MVAVNPNGAPAGKTVALYARYSSDKQSEKSVDDQLRDCRAFAERNGWTVGEVFADTAVTGKANQSRPAYQRLLEAMEGGHVDIILAESLDRFSRVQAHSAHLHDLCVFNGIELWSLGGRVTEIDVGLRGTMSALYLKELADKTRRGLRGVIEDGRSGGGKCFGYRSTSEVCANGKRRGGIFVIEDTQAAWVVWIFEKYAAGWSCARIAAELNRQGVPGPSGGNWKDSTINGDRTKGTGILNNELYVGFRIWNRRTWRFDPVREKRTPFMNPPAEWKTCEVPHLRIVPQELWDEVKTRQKLLDDRMQAQRSACGGDTKRQGLGAARSSIKLLTPILFCGECGSKMTGGSATHVRCQSAKQTSGSGCSHTRTYPRAAVHERLFTALKCELMKDAALETFFEVYKAEIAKLNAGHQAERRNQEKELQALSGKIDKLLDALMNGMTTTSVKQKLEELELQKQRLETELARPAPEPLVCHPETADRYRAKIASLEAAINDPEHGVAARDAVLQLIDSLRLIPRPDRGKGEFDLEVEGALGALLRAAGVAEKDAASIDAASCSKSSGQLVAGARNPLKNLFCAHDVSAWRYGLQATDLAKQIEDAYQALMDGDGTFEEVPHGP